MSHAVPRWEFHATPDPVAGIEAAYQGIHFEHLGSGDPSMNQLLEVRAEGAETDYGWQRVLLVTPWVAMRVYLPEDPGDLDGLPEPEELEVEEDGRVRSGCKVRFPFQGKIYDLEVAYDPRIGHHLVETLLADMRACEDTEEALHWARIRAGGGAAEGSESTTKEPRRLSRRDLFRGLLGRR